MTDLKKTAVTVNLVTVANALGLSEERCAQVLMDAGFTAICQEACDRIAREDRHRLRFRDMRAAARAVLGTNLRKH